MNRIRQGKRGMTLENAIEHTNAIYKNKGVALIDKVPTPWSVQYNKQTGKVARAFPQKKGTVDFIGISQGKSIAFDTKNTNSKTSFPMGNVEAHQVKYLLDHQSQGGSSFFIVSFAKNDETYLIIIDDFKTWWDAMKDGGRKSIPHAWFKDNCNVIKSKNGVPLDYLEHVN